MIELWKDYTDLCYTTIEFSKRHWVACTIYYIVVVLYSMNLAYGWVDALIWKIKSFFERKSYQEVDEDYI